MVKPERTSFESLTTWGGWAAGISGLLTALTQISESVHTIVKPFFDLSPFTGWIVTIVLIVVGSVALRFGSVQRSRLLQPDVLLLRSHKIEHLKGREEDIDRLIQLCREYRLVHLVGESGVGKSALITAGLCPRLQQNDLGLFPVYLDVWGEHWEEGPRLALYDALRRSLPEQDQQDLHLSHNAPHGDLVATIKQYQSKSGRLPLIIFDQFDDYQTRHRTHFLAGPQKTWLPVQTVVETNGFWHDINTLLERQDIHCLIVTRSDTSAGLESVRFVEPKVYSLDRLQQSVVESLLHELTTTTDEQKPVIDAPEQGWGQLKRRLTEDLNQEGAILPIQMKIAFQGLAQLRFLTVGDYQKAGGLRGLEAASIEQQLIGLEHNTGVPRAEIRKLLLALINREANVEALKTIPRTVPQLAKQLHGELSENERALDQRIRGYLEQLENRELVRMRVDSDTQQQVWLLDHDYLCRGVVEAERQADQWYKLLESQHRAYEEAGTQLRRKWRALLSPYQQMKLFWHRLAGQFRYGALRLFAILSLLRLVPIIAITLLLYIGWSQFSTWQQARTLFSVIGLNEERIDRAELDIFWTLAQTRESVRLNFLQQALETSGNAERFRRRLEIAVHSIVGLNPQFRNTVIHDVLIPCLQNLNIILDAKRVCIETGIALSTDNVQFLRLVGAFIEKGLITLTDEEARWRGDGVFVKTLESVQEKFTTSQVQEVLPFLFDALENPSSSFVQGLLSRTLAATTNKLTPEQIGKAFPLLMKIVESSDPELSGIAVNALSALGKKLTAEQCRDVISVLLIAIVKTQNREKFPNGSLWEPLVALAQYLPFNQAERVLPLLLSSLNKPSNSPYTQQTLITTLVTIAGKLPPNLIEEKVLPLLLTTFDKTGDRVLGQLPVASLDAMMRKLHPEQIERVVPSLLASLQSTSLHPYAQQTMAMMMGATTAWLTPEHAGLILPSLLTALKGQEDLSTLQTLVAEVATIATYCSDNQVETALIKILEATAVLYETGSSYYPPVSANAGKIRTLAERLPSEGARRIFPAILTAMSKTSRVVDLETPIVVLSAVTKYLSPRQIEQALQAIFNTIKADQQLIPFIPSPENSLSLPTIIVSFTSITEHLTDKQIVNLLTPLLSPPSKKNSEISQMALAITLGAVVKRLSPDQLKSILRKLLDRPYRGPFISQREEARWTVPIVAMAHGFTLEQIEIFLPLLIDALGTTQDFSAREPLLPALAEIGNKLTVKQIDRLLPLLLRILNEHTEFRPISEPFAMINPLAEQFTTEQIGQFADPLLTVLRNSTNLQWNLFDEIDGFIKIAGKFTHEQRKKTQQWLLFALGNADDPRLQHDSAIALTKIPSEMTLQHLVDIMKWPTCLGEASDIILEKFENDAHQKFDKDLWKAADWMRRNGLDVTSAPQRPTG